jgi:2-dehydropantoate 2-reductase
MDILIYGAGVVGSFFAAILQNSGHHVSILARGKRLSDIKDRGIILYDPLQKKQITARVRVVETLEPEDFYDMVIVAMRKHQVNHILPILAHNKKIHSVVFMVNNAEGPELFIAALGKERVLLSFSATGGELTDDRIECLLSTSYEIPMGCVNEPPHLDEIIWGFEQAGIRVRIIEDMDAWLKYHVALVSPLANAVIVCGGTAQLARNSSLISLTIQAIREGFSCLKSLGYPVTPHKFLLFQYIPAWIMKIGMRLMLKTRKADMAISRHALHAVDEMVHLSKEFSALIGPSKIPTPAIDSLNEMVRQKLQ